MTDLRSRVRYELDETMGQAEAGVRLVMADGDTREAHVTQARVSLERPLTEAELRVKIEGLVEPVLPARTNALMLELERLDRATSLADLLDVATPDPERTA